MLPQLTRQNLERAYGAKVIGAKWLGQILESFLKSEPSGPFWSRLLKLFPRGISTAPLMVFPWTSSCSIPRQQPSWVQQAPAPQRG